MIKEFMDLKNTLEDAYGIDIVDIELFRDMIGKVYHIQTQKCSYMFKIYRKSNIETAYSSLEVMRYIYEHQGPVPKVYLTQSRASRVKMKGEIGILFEYVIGEHADKTKHETQILTSISKIHQIMETYPHQLIKRDQTFFIDRYLDILKSAGFDNQKINEMKDMGIYFFNMVKKLHQGFYHGDMHTGNIIINPDDKAIMIDFDACGILSPLIDYMTYFDRTNFNQFHEKDLIETVNILKKQMFIDQISIKDMLAMIPVRHFEIIATILNAQGLSDDDNTFFEQQYQWVKQFYKAFQKLKI